MENKRGGISTGTESSMASAASVSLQQALARLRSTVSGSMIVPGDAGYDGARTPFLGGFDLQPAVIVQPVNANEVARVIEIAREEGIELAVRSGGHSGAGHCLTDGGIVIDLRNMKALDIDPESRTAWAEAGLTAGEYTQAAGDFGLATGFGDTGTVGIGGITLGGGIGFLVRKYGMTIDNLLAVELVTAGGQILMVDADNYPDLFWALRGGGGNFGVVTRFQFRLQDVSKVVGGMLILPATPENVTRFVNEAIRAPEELTAIINVMPAPPMPFLPPEMHGKVIILALMMFVGDAEAGERAYAPFRQIAEPLADMIRPMAYAEMFMPEEEEYHPMALNHNLFINGVDSETAGIMIQYLEVSDAPLRAVQIRPLGGAVSRVPPDATAYPHRLAPILVNLVNFYTSPADKLVRRKWLADLSRDLDQGVPGNYSNLTSDDSPESVRLAFPKATWDRLAEIKARWDPTNLFHRNYNVPPA